MSVIIRHEWDINYIWTLPAQIQLNVRRKILEEVFITTKCTQHKTLHTLKTDVFKLPHNKNIGKLSSKYELFFLDQAKFSFDPSQILILQYLIPTTSLLPPRSLSNFPLVTWNSSLSQSLSCSSSLSLLFHTPFDHKS